MGLSREGVPVTGSRGAGGPGDRNLTVAIQQPEHLPWMGFFNKMARCDRFVLLDNVQFKRRYFENRNRIRAGEDSRWITVPVRSKGRYTQWIRDVEVDNDKPWSGRYWRAVHHAYARAPHYRAFAPRFQALLSREWSRLADLNTALIDEAREILGLETPMVLASDLIRTEGRGSELLLQICRATGASRYLSGPDGRSYLDLDAFRAAGIEIVFHDYRHPAYGQSDDPFVSHLSIIDLIFNQGSASADLVRAPA